MNNLENQLKDLGFEEKFVQQAIKMTNDIEQATNIILQLQEDEKKVPAQFTQTQNQQQNQFAFQDYANIPFNIDFSNIQMPSFLSSTTKRYKMVQYSLINIDTKVFLVRSDLKMGVGKIAAQTGHAVLGAYQQMQTKTQENEQILMEWQSSGQAKIVLKYSKVESQQELQEYERKAQKAGLNTYVVRDAGRTQVEPGSMTVAAIGPGDSDLIDSITGELKLL